MENKTRSFEDLETIRTIMEKSSRFLSLSGLSGVFNGLIALAGAAVAFFLILKGHSGKDYFAGLSTEEILQTRFSLLMVAGLVLVAALTVSLVFSYRKSLKTGQKIWTPVSRRLITSMLVPLITGGLFIILLLQQDIYFLIVPSMLIFYGLALVNAGKFTYGELFWLGLFEIILGMAAAFVPQTGLLFWSLGFGVLHIIYGLLMYRKYEK